MGEIVVPKVLECSRLIAKSNSKSHRTVKDYALDFYVDGNRRTIIDGVEYPISKGSIVFTKPRQKIESFGDYNCYVMSLDLSGKINIPPEQYLRTRADGFQEQCNHILFDEFPSVFKPKHYEDILELFKIIHTNIYPFPENREVINKALKSLMLLISADIALTHTVTTEKAENDYTSKVCAFLNKNYQNQILVKDLAALVSINQNYLIRIFKEQKGSTPNQYLNEVRLFHARQLLCESSIPISEISARCGFATPAYFTKCFRKKFGETPSEFRR